MKNSLLITGVVAALLCSGCSTAFWGGAASGVAGTGVGYEYHAKKEMDRIDTELKAGRMTQEEYNIRKDQIQRLSVIN